MFLLVKFSDHISAKIIFLVYRLSSLFVCHFKYHTNVINHTFITVKKPLLVILILVL